MLQTLLVDDEPMALINLRHALSPFPEFTIAAACTVPEDALDVCTHQAIDVVFIDIEMPRIKGLELAKHLRKLRPELLIVFVTAYRAHAVQAFETDALDYLVKPVTPARMTLTVQKIKQRCQHQVDSAPLSSPPPAAAERIPAKSGDRIYLLETSDILYISVEGRNVSALTAEGSFKLQGSLIHWESLLSSQHFLRCHNAYIVNLRKIEYIVPLFKNAYSLKISGREETIPVSRTFAKKLREFTQL
ncbi:MAG TPA: LytTR family DNA-binding domain-containing protein [Patescibacteria group bacterium]|nr:LytTR family DNA-binding domain-containing protein [Patescibacteria group bacterium]